MTDDRDQVGRLPSVVCHLYDKESAMNEPNNDIARLRIHEGREYG